ncbi:major facilitator superfamily domain-containing protein 6-like [Ambystoma mexicanum]|uniref:major facilitator superfamily domain-containing protein 6-like n=1 Tax=Ambystoma mexicanum TaxID=8296 RepID=UPI0037E9C90D
MNENKQLDVSRALGVAGVFQFLHCVAKSCVMPFLTIYFRHLGLTPPLVGIVMGMKHLTSVLWAPFCSYFAKNHRRRRILMCGSLLLSVGAGLLLTLIPPMHKEVVYRLCNGSLHSGDRFILTGIWVMKDVNNMTTTRPLALATSPEMVSSSPIPRMTALTSSEKGADGKRALLTTSAKMNNITDKDEGTRKNNNESISTGLASAMEGVAKKLQNSQMKALEPLAMEETQFHSLEAETSNHQSALNYSEDDVFSGDVGEIPASLAGSKVLENPPNISRHWKTARDVNFEVVHGTYVFNPEHKTFLMVLGAVVLWELFASPLEWTADDSLYEYLDFVDATDRHGRLWIGGYLGTSIGACSIAALVDNMSCYLSANIPRMAVHCYGYALLITASLLVGVFYPIHVSKKTEHGNKTLKALGLIGNDGRMLLMAVTVFLTGAVVSTANNFLFWQMQDIGSCELYMGVSIAVALLAELLLFAFKNKLLKSFSASCIVALSLSCLAIQVLYYSFLWTSWAVLPIQTLSAFSNGALWWVANSLADDVATPGTERSLQMVLNGLSYGCGASLGSFSSGFIVNSFSLAVLYRASSIALILWLVLFLIVQTKLPRQRKINYSRLLAADTSDLSDSDEDQERDWLVKAMKDESTNKKR